MNFLLPTLSWLFIFKDNSVLLNKCLGKEISSNLIQCTESQFGEIFCWTWLGLLFILMSNVIDVFCILFCFKEINKSTEESRKMLSKQAYINRKRYDQVLCLKTLQQSSLYSKICHLFRDNKITIQLMTYQLYYEPTTLKSLINEQGGYVVFLVLNEYSFIRDFRVADFVPFR